MRYAFNLDPKSKEVATIQELDIETEPTEWNDDLTVFEGTDLGRQFREIFEEPDDMIGPAGELDFDERR